MKNRFIKIGDFGLASFQKFNKSHEANKGTDRYIAPEVVRDRDSNKIAIYDTKVDVYSLGVVFEDLFRNDINE
jgi:serine/threonine protein kinase